MRSKNRQHIANRPPKLRGVTFIELIVTVTIVGILTAVAIPSFRDTTAGNQMATHSNELIGAINFARSQSIMQGQRVVMCRSLNNVCQTDWSNSWQEGWMVFVDRNNDATFNGTDTLLRVNGAWSGSDAIQPSAVEADGVTAVTDGSFFNYISFSPDGSVRSITSGLPIKGRLGFLNCAKKNKNFISVNLIGQVSLLKLACP